MDERMRRQLVFVLIVCLFILVPSACFEEKEKTEAHVEEVQEKG